ncbi:MAG: MFS transporter [Deltaproteobacteria bacterium]|nr:MAG: MFS transporter [Deltaproteobacteria bacterium]
MEAETLAERPAYSKWNTYYTTTLLYLLLVFDYIDRFVIVALFPFLKSDWGLTDAQCGLMVSAVFWAIVVLTLPIGALIDRWSRKKTVGLMAIIWSLGTAAGALTRNFTQLFATRFIIGAGEAGYSAGGTALLSAIFKPEKRARVIGFWYSAIPLGQALGIVLGGIIAVNLGWRNALGLVALPGLILAIMFFWVKDYRTVDLVKSVPAEGSLSKARMNKREVIRELVRSKSLLFNNLAFAACTFTIVALTTWLPSYFQRFEGMTIERSGLMASVIMVLAIVGGPLGGFLTDQFHKKRSNSRMLFPAITCAIAALLLFVAFLLHGSLQFGFLLAMGLFIIMFAPGAIAVTQDVVHPGLRSTSLSINVIFQNLLGSALGPLVVGALSDMYGLDKALLFLPATLILAGILFFIGSFFYERDTESVEKIEIVFDAK